MNTETSLFKELEFDNIKTKLKEFASTDYAKDKIDNLKPILNEARLRQSMKETDSAKSIMNFAGSLRLPSVKEINEILKIAERDGLLYCDQLDKARMFTVACKRLKNYLKKAEVTEESLAYTGQGIDVLDAINLEINRCIKGSDIDSNATSELMRIRRKSSETEQKIKSKLDDILKSKKAWMADSFVSLKNGHYTLPVKKEYKNQIAGSCISVSTTGSTCFIEPSSVNKLSGLLDELKFAEQAEIDKILYTLTDIVYGYRNEIKLNIEIINTLDFAFSKAKLSTAMDAVTPSITTNRRMKIVQGRHPLINKENCVPLDFELGNNNRGIVITGPNTGGKTVALKLVGLFSVMAQSGLHVPCESAEICMNSNVLCDIGDGQNISESLSTFSAHIKSVISILRHTTKESLVLLDELGSGTDPDEGMGLAIAILEELRRSECLFVATTHYPEVKTYAEQAECLTNARMTFDKETLKPQYQLVIGEAGESCAFYIARRLGLPNHLLISAERQLNRLDNNSHDNQPTPNINYYNQPIPNNDNGIDTVSVQKIEKIPKQNIGSQDAEKFNIGDSVTIYPEKKIGIVYKTSDAMGELIIQVKDKKERINHKRLKLKNSASELYPPDYDFSILFDTVENRKARHKMGKKLCSDLEIKYDEHDLL